MSPPEVLNLNSFKAESNSNVGFFVHAGTFSFDLRPPKKKNRELTMPSP